MRMAELKCKDGTVIQISDETEADLRKAFGSKPNYEDSKLKVWVSGSANYPISILSAIGIDNDNYALTRDVEDVKKFIGALQECVGYCEKHNLG
jgi:hypothetical protein